MSSYPYYEDPVWYRCDTCGEESVHPLDHSAAYDRKTDSYGPIICGACREKVREHKQQLDELGDCGFEASNWPKITPKTAGERGV